MDELMNMMNSTENYIESREVAEMIGKEHNKLLRDIRNYIEQLRLSNIGHSDYFTLSTYKNSQNKDMPCYLITKKGCELIAHKLTGTKGTEFTAKYIDRFHKMENTIKQFVPQTREQLISMALIEANKVIVEQTQLIETQKQEIEEKTNQIIEMKPKVTYFDKVMQCKDLLSITDIAKDYGWGAVKLNNFLKEQKSNLNVEIHGIYIKNMLKKDMQVQKLIYIMEKMVKTMQNHTCIGHRKVDYLFML